MQKIAENTAVVIEEDLIEKPTVTCMNVASIITDALRTFVKKMINSAEERYRISKVKLDEWVVVELEPEFKYLKSDLSMKNRLWVDVPDSDEE